MTHNLARKVRQLIPLHRHPEAMLTLFIIMYLGYFSWYSINRHNTLNSYAADLSLIDQPMWNTVIGPGGFMELTWGRQQQPRLAEHFEPLLVPIAGLFFIWDDVRILLIAQSVALGLGGLPIFWLAREQLAHTFSDLKAGWLALIFVVVYLLSPHLQAANIADFHADPFVVTPLLLAFWYARQHRWRWMWLWAITAMATKETLPTLTAMLGLWLVLWQGLFVVPTSVGIKSLKRPLRTQLTINPASKHGLWLIGVSTAWFFSATFLIVAPLAQHYFGTDGPIYLHRYSNETANLTEMVTQPSRWYYLLGLFASVGFLPLLAPKMLLLGLPVLVANTLSDFPGQYSGEQHYSAPLVAPLLIATIYGSRRLIQQTSRQRIAWYCLCLWLLTWSLGYHINHGWTPLATRTEDYVMTPPARLLPDFLAEIPPAAVVSASAAIHPHLAHRQIIYLFPTVEQADYLLLDVTDIPGVHPNDAYSQIMNRLTSNWQLLRAEHGLILARKSTGNQSTNRLPPAFYDFARRSTVPSPFPQPLIFGDRLRLLSYDIENDVDDGLTFRFYWQAIEPLPAGLHLWPLLLDDWGNLLIDPTQVPQIATVWYPPANWQPGEIIMTETLPQFLPKTFHLGMVVGPADRFYDPQQHWPVRVENQLFDPPLTLNHWTHLVSCCQQGRYVSRQTPQLTHQLVTPIHVPFENGLTLTGYHLDPGLNKPVLLQWLTTQPQETDYTIFLHLLDSRGNLVAQHDGYPNWFFPRPTSQWPVNQPLMDRQPLQLPPDLPTGRYTLHLGLYDLTTLERLNLLAGGNSYSLGELELP